MMEQDEELTLRIKTVFEDYDDGMHDQGWALLREKFPEKPHRKIPVWWYSGIAACLLLIAGYWLFLYATTDQVITKQDQHGVSHPQITKKHNPPTVNDPIQPKNERQEFGEDKLNRSVTSRPHHVAKKNGPVNTPQKNVVQLQPEASTFKALDPSKALAIIQKVDTITTVNPTKDSQKDPLSAVAQTKKTTAEFLAEQSQLAAQQGAQKEKSTSKKFFEVFTGTFLNYTGNNEAKLNAGFGLNANIQVAKKLYLSVGAGISQNKLTYGGDQAENSDQMNSATVMMGTNPNYMLASTYTFVERSVDARLLNLDLPITIKFYPTKSQTFYISTGINSNSYLAQRYDYNYKLTNAGVNGGNPTFYEETDKRKLNGFSFANSAIFAIGINQNLGKNNSLILEPYFKPALGYMGVNRLKINMAGINLKFSFSNSEKK